MATLCVINNLYKNKMSQVWLEWNDTLLVVLGRLRSWLCLIFDSPDGRTTTIHHVNQRMRGLTSLLTSTKDLWFPRGNHVHVTQKSPQPPMCLPSCGWDCLEPLYFIKGYKGLWDNDYWGAQVTLLLITFRREREREREEEEVLLCITCSSSTTCRASMSCIAKFWFGRTG